MYIIYNCGYKRRLNLTGKITGRKYAFMRRYVTEVNDEDGEEFLKMTANDIQWCPTTSKKYPPFMKMEAWCNAEEGRFSKRKPLKKYISEEYLKQFSL